MHFTAIKFFDDYFAMVSQSIHELTKGKRLKILTSKQMLDGLLIALSQLKADNNSENILNEIRQTVFSLHQLKEITKKVYHKIIKSIQIQTDAIFMNSESSKASHPHSSLLNLNNKKKICKEEEKCCFIKSYTYQYT